MFGQISRNLHQKVHPRRLPRSRPEQRGERVSGPVRGEVLRGERQGVGEDAGRGGAERWRCGGRGRHVWLKWEQTANTM